MKAKVHDEAPGRRFSAKVRCALVAAFPPVMVSAQDPACAFSDHYNCPIPPKGNTLPAAIRAGEMDSHYH